MEITRELAKFNNIKFHDKEHIYYLDCKRKKSVTSVIGKYKHPFDKDYWSQKKADEIFRDINIVVNGFYTMNHLAYWSLRLGGFVAWNGHRKRNNKIPELE